MNSIRIKVNDIEEKERILKSLSGSFNIIKCSKMFKLSDKRNNRSSKGYYIYLEVEEKKNNRGAGRKEKFSEEQKVMIKMYRYQNKTLREIAKLFNCSPSTIHSILKKEEE